MLFRKVMKRSVLNASFNFILSLSITHLAHSSISTPPEKGRKPFGVKCVDALE